MFCKVQCAFVLVTAPVILSLKIQVDGKMDFGPKWNYEYSIKPLETDPTRTFAKDKKQIARENAQPKFIDIIIRNNKSNPRLIQVAEAHIFDPISNKHEVTNTKGDDEVKQIINIVHQDTSKDGGKHRGKNHYFKPASAAEDLKTTEETLVFSNEHTETPRKHNSDELTKIGDHGKRIVSEDILTKTGKHVKHLVRIAGDIDAPKPDKLETFEESTPADSEYYGATVLTPGKGKKKKHKRHRVKPEKYVELEFGSQKNRKHHLVKQAENLIAPEVNTQNNTKHKRHRYGDQINGTIPFVAENMKNIPNEAFAEVVTEEITRTNPRVTSVVEEEPYTVQDIYVKPLVVKDDPKIKEFTKHIYEQSLKTIESIKEKMPNYEMKKEANLLIRSYEERFGDFVRETQNHKIKTRLGNQKVILNTLETSNRILDRLVNYMIGKMDKKGILRNSGSENVILNELNIKKDLENKHICAKMKICPTNESLTKFYVDILQIMLSSNDNKLIELRDALTEAMKNLDNTILYPDTKKRYHKGIRDFEKYDVNTVRAIFFMIKNILASKNRPIRVVGKDDGRVNKTLAFLDLIDGWEKKLPPNEQNILEWNDMRNSFKEWRSGKRQDTLDLMQHFTEYVNKAIDKEDAKATQLQTDRDINIMLGY